ncbi:M56 family metallopeptidase [Brevibacillus sp. SIMBA_076]|uniref:M56 family metallopeptidase n=2 Tax=unclassified Brevibacillus TaxID=2684853 RepID=UPI00397BA100
MEIGPKRRLSSYRRYWKKKREKNDNDRGCKLPESSVREKNMEILCNVFLWFFYSTLAASAVALLVMVIQRLFHRHLSARLQHALWLIVLVRLLLPDFPSSPASIFNVATHIKMLFR